VIDDSAVIRKVLSERLSRYSDIEVVGTALDPYNRPRQDRDAETGTSSRWM